MKRYLVGLFIVLMVAGVAWAKSLSMNVEFSFDQEFEPELSMFKLYYQDSSSGEYVLVNEVADVTVRTFDTPTFDLPPGKTTNFFLAAVYKDGTEDMSPVYPWKFTGKPTIVNVNKR